MITDNTLSSVILRDSCAYTFDFHWRGLEESKTIPVKAQIQSSQAAEFLSKAGNRWTGIAAGGAATSLEKLPRHVLQAGTPGQHCCSAQGRSSVPVDGWSHSPCSSGRCHFGEEPDFSLLYACLFPGFACCSRRRKVHQKLIYVSRSYISGVRWRPWLKELSHTSFAAAPHCPVSLLNSPFWSAQLCDKEFLYLGGLTEATRETSGVRWGVVSYVLCETEKKRWSSTVSLVCAQPLTQSQSVSHCSCEK